MAKNATPDYAEDYTVDEQMAAVLAGCIENGDIGMPTAMCPLGDAAICLAKHTHAPGMIWYGHNGWDPRIEYTLADLHDTEKITLTGVFMPDWGDVASQQIRGMVGFQIVAPAQLDKHGNMNNNLIGDHVRPTVRFPGSVGMPEIGCFHKKVLVYEPRHERKVFAEKVDFVSGLGQRPGGPSARRAAGIIGGGPIIVVSNLAVMDFDDETGTMRVRSVHPGVTLEEVQDSTSFDLIVADGITETEAPTRQQVDLLRNLIDPKGQRRHRMPPPTSAW